MKVIVGIHGLNNKPPKDEHARDWKAAIREGLLATCGTDLNFEFRLVFWADLLHDPLLRAAPSLLAAPPAVGPGEAPFDDEPYVPVPKSLLREYDETLWMELRAGTVNFGTVSLDRLKGLFGFDDAADRLLERLLKDLATYYHNDPVRTRDAGIMGGAKEVLRQELKRELLGLAGHDVLLIAHSMGTIIAHDTLRDLGQANPDFRIKHLVTAGSPLGLHYVKAEILRERTYDPVLRTPTNVDWSWVNFSDPKDPVAVDWRISDDYGRNDVGVQVVDDLVSNTYVRPYDAKPNHHKIFGYLRAPELSWHLYRFLR